METHGRSELDLSMCLEDALNQLPVSDIQLPWEQGVWKDIFKPQALCVDSVQKFTRPIFHDTTVFSVAVSAEDNKRRKTVVKLESGWTDIVRPGTDVHREEECEAQNASGFETLA